uniref:Glucosidase 2 subunit beta n=1 Tax=Blastobotrys adeninivorans TaxID=409370 RepID=A0A060TB09_BLAAD
MKYSLVWLAPVVVAGLKVRGVPEDRQHLYQPTRGDQWACLKNPEIVLSVDQINDDYCDCPDGSDEPGTSACNNGVFYCNNVGHIPAWIPSSRVNDGVCDYDLCCDGSDEAGLDPNLCPDRCAEIHAEYEANIKRQQKLLEAGLKAREKLDAKAQEIVKDLEKKIADKQQNLKYEKQQLAAFQKSLKDAIEEDKRLKLESGVSEESLSLPQELAELSKELQQVIAEHKEYVAKVQQLESQYGEVGETLDRLKTGYNPNFNDPAVKEALRSWDEIKGKGSSTGSEGQANKLQELVKRLEAYRPGTSCESQSILPAPIQQKLSQLRLWLVNQGLLADTSSHSEADEPEAIRIERAKVEGTERKIGDLEKAVSELQADRDANYGQGDVLRALKDVCMKNHIGEYDYEVCFFKSASQDGNGHHSNLGSYSSLTVRDDGTFRMEFDRGTRCWNGPVRRANVEFTCGETNELTIVSEPERCEYFFKATSPAACKAKDFDPPKVLNIVHDEL